MQGISLNIPVSLCKFMLNAKCHYGKYCHFYVGEDVEAAVQHTDTVCCYSYQTFVAVSLGSFGQNAIDWSIFLKVR